MSVPDAVGNQLDDGQKIEQPEQPVGAGMKDTNAADQPCPKYTQKVAHPGDQSVWEYRFPDEAAVVIFIFIADNVILDARFLEQILIDDIFIRIVAERFYVLLKVQRSGV